LKLIIEIIKIMGEKESGKQTKESELTIDRTCLEPSFWTEVAPYYLPSYVFVVSHIVY
jgi:hypothetical protein